ncbi:MAG: LysM peptidoglycan-binding domain-containing protein [Chlamydiae bacterium]|nr:LysM peptidoglycan-binding domain-containing protein [Chlamydiota bacterium]MBI3266406.1 LysM peptidoglycan-binding domain-containing protein [Chlamydiota bacterium]
MEKPESEPYWADFVQKNYPTWTEHYWSDRQLWGNRGYLVGGPPSLPEEKSANLHSKGEVVDIQKGELPKVMIKEPGLSQEALLKEIQSLPQPPKPTQHVVKKGECLWYIAGYDEIYANPLKWPKLYKANRDKIRDPDWIYPGQVLIVPRD